MCNAHRYVQGPLSWVCTVSRLAMGFAGQGALPFSTQHIGRRQSHSLSSIRNYGLRALSAVSGAAHLVWFPIFNVQVRTDYTRRWKLGRKRYLRMPHPRL